MYTILINNDNTLTQSVKENIMHRESNVHTFRFLVDQVWVDKGIETSMRNYTCVLEYRTPISEKYTPVVLTPSEELYKDHIEYILPINTQITSEVGDLELKFVFTWLEMNADGSFTEHSRKTSSTVIKILPIRQWSDYIADSNLDSIAQMILTNQAQAEQLKLYADYLMMSKADNIKYNAETNELSLIGDGKKLSSVTLEESDCNCDEGVPAVDFDEGIAPVEPGEFDNVVEF